MAQQADQAAQAPQAPQPFTGEEIMLPRMTTVPGGIPPLATDNEGDDPEPDNIPYWLAPWPYDDILPASAERTGKVHVARAGETRFLAKFLERLLRNPGYAVPLARREDYLTDRDTAWALNAYNLRTAAREHGCWALFHRFQNTSVFQAPRNLLGGPIILDGPRLARALGPRPGYYNFARDLGPGEPPNDWVSPAQDPWRRGPNAKRYRLVCWMHRHEAPNALWKNDQYSMTVWDRDTDDLTWHDPWPGTNSAQRFAEIQNIWTACQDEDDPHFWPGMPAANLTRRSYTSLVDKQQNDPAYAHLQPRFSQTACVALGVWLVNHIDQAGVLAPPDADDVLSGMRPELMPHLAAVLLQTLREAPAITGVGKVSIAKDSAVVQARVRKTYRTRDSNTWLRAQMRTKLEAMYPDPHASNWLVDNLT